MPPKSKSSQPGKKVVEKKAEKVVEDKTFGLKNKKGAKQQRFIQQIQHQAKPGGKANTSKSDDPRKLEREKKLKEQKEMNLLFRPVTTQKVEKGTDPKSVLCAFYKQGQCTKGERCKFSHDLNLERKSEKRSVYVDLRDDDEDTMENWDESKLQEVVEKKHGESEKKMPPTTIICKYFLDAVEQRKYGWFWTCPNGTSCIYRHALPPGFMLKRDLKEEKKDEESLEDLIEREMATLTGNLTKVTQDTFIAWKKRKLKELQDASLQLEEKKRSDYKAGRHANLSGRDMFFFNPDLAKMDQVEDGDETFDLHHLEQDESTEEFHEIRFDDWKLESLQLDDEVNGKAIVKSGKGDVDSVPVDIDLFMEDINMDELNEALKDISVND
ncbi:zinc finger CCCH domain-containing protein 15 homolog [Anabrus simplex]|uniref:zinc finger CCCH domain-containing protein 15 homolog n=1 Tax=Anabrus simplex TaxID=316456 RepID=UPI0035A2F233